MSITDKTNNYTSEQIQEHENELKGLLKRVMEAPLNVRRAKALSFSGCESRPATFAPAGSNWSSRGGNEAAEASGVEGSVRNLANMQAVM
jgi:hypothetical protein